MTDAERIERLELGLAVAVDVIARLARIVGLEHAPELNALDDAVRLLERTVEHELAVDIDELYGLVRQALARAPRLVTSAEWRVLEANPGSVPDGTIVVITDAPDA
jgi:hypothetical protein